MVSQGSSNVNVNLTATDRITAVLQGMGNTAVDVARRTREALGAVGLATAGFLQNAISETTEFADQVDGLNDQLGIGAEKAASWAVAFKLGEADVESGTKAIKKLAMDVREGGEKLGELGVSTRNAAGDVRDFEDIMLDLAGVFEDMPDGLEKTALAQDLFGKSGAAMIPFLNKGKEGLRDLLGAAEEYGLTISDETLEANDALAQAMNRVQFAMQGVSVQVGAALLPHLAALAEAVAKAIAFLIALIRPFNGLIGPVLAVVAVVGSLIGGFALLQTALLPIMPALAGIMGALGAVAAPIGIAIAALVALKLAWDANFGGIREKTADVVEFVRGKIDEVRQIALGFVDMLSFNFLNPFKEELQAFKGTAFEPLIQAFEVPKNLLSTLGNLLKGETNDAAIAWNLTMGALQGTLATIGDILADRLNPGLSAAQITFQTVSTIVQDVLVGSFDRLAKALTQVGTSLFEWFPQDSPFWRIGGAMVSIGDAMAGLRAGDFIGVGMDLAAAFMSIWDAIVNLSQTLARQLQPAWDGLSAAMQDLQPEIAQLWETFGELGVALAPIIDVVLPVLSDVLGVVVVLAVAGLVGAIRGLVGLITGALPGAVQAFAGGVQSFLGVMRLMGEIATTTVNVIRKLFEGDLVGAGEAARAGFARMGSAISDIMEGLKRGVLGTIQALVGGMLGMFAGVASGVIETLMTMIFGIKNEQMPAMSRAVLDALAKLQADAPFIVSSFLSDIKAKLWNAVESFKDAAGGIGRGITDGIRDAIMGGIGAIESAARSAAEAALTAAKRALGIASPSRAFFEVGVDVTTGLVNALKAGAPAVAAATAALTPIPSAGGPDFDSLTRALARPAASTLTIGSIVVHANSPAEGAAAGRAIIDTIAAEARRSGLSV